jgi:hypothetical protein
MPFFPRVLVHRVGLDSGVIQGVAIQPKPGVLLEPVPQLQQVHPVTAQLPGQWPGGDALGDAAEDQDDRRRLAPHALEGGPGPGVKGAAAAPALVVEHRGAVAAVDAESLALTAAGAGQAAGVEQVDEPGGAGVLVHEVVPGEVQGGASRAPGAPRATP